LRRVERIGAGRAVERFAADGKRKKRGRHRPAPRDEVKQHDAQPLNA
jgi:hypothetical protein